MIIIKNSPNKLHNLAASDMEDGRAYESENGIIVIGNAIMVPGASKLIKGFSLRGCVIIYGDTSTMFREVDLEVTVSG